MAPQGSQRADRLALAPLQGEPEDSLWETYAASSAEKALGHGSYGRVVLHRRLADNVRHALKFVDVSSNPAWHNEYLILRKVAHENIVKVFEVFQPCPPSRPQAVLALRPADIDLHAFLERRSGRVAEVMAQTISRQICRALAHVHDHQIIHRDVKPQNILLTCVAEGKLHAALADFGMARSFPQSVVPCSDAGQMPDGLMTRRVVTACYRAPELMCVKAPKAMYNYAIDVWSLGCVIFELLEGQPFTTNVSPDGWAKRVGSVIGPCPGHLPWAAQCTSQAVPECAQGLGLRRGSASARSCVMRLLRWDPGERLSCKALLDEPWLHIQGVETSLVPLQGHRPDMMPMGPPARNPGMTHTSQCSTLKELKVSWSFGQRVLKERQVVRLTGTEKCKCSGHCYVPRHRTQGCDRQEVVLGSDRCVDCVCQLCLCPRFHGPLCHRHKKIYDQMPLEVRVVREARGAVTWLLPADLQDFSARSMHMEGDLALAILLALVKDPAASATLTNELSKDGRPTKDASVEAIEDALLTMLATNSSASDTAMKQLNRQGVGRFLGAASTCRLLGVIEVLNEECFPKPQPASFAPLQGPKKIRITAKQAPPAESSSQPCPSEPFELGLTRRKYTPTKDTGVLRAFVEWARSNAGLMTNATDNETLFEAVRQACEVDEGMSATVPLWKSSPKYAHAFLRRKLVIRALSAAKPEDRRVEWGEVPLGTLRLVCPDSHGFVGACPMDWSAADMSEFCFGRCDWAMFVSAMTCLFSEAVQKKKCSDKALLQAVASPSFLSAAKAHHLQHGYAQHPFNLLQSMGVLD